MHTVVHKRFIARRLTDGLIFMHLQYVDLSGEYAVVAPFSQETHSTVFIDATVTLLLPDGSPLPLPPSIPILSRTLTPVINP